mgnify:CR=1 FL=1
MYEHWSHGHMWLATGVIVFLSTLLALLAFFYMRPARRQAAPVARLRRARPSLLSRDPRAEARADHDATEMRDTIFILPDISHYTRFMTGSEFSFAHAQHIVFSLINSMIVAASRTVELSKLEGDAALFFVDADRHPADRIGACILDIFAAFYAEQARLIDTNMCACRACQSIGDLDLKIFVHRGQAARFEFRGSIDHFGVDMIVLHRLMKNGVHTDRYIMVTDAARSHVAFSADLPSIQTEEDLRGYGKIAATVFTLDDAFAAFLTKQASSVLATSRWTELCLKLRANLASLRRVLSIGDAKSG